MMNVYFGNFSNGRLLRLPYLGYSLLLMALLVAFIFGTILIMGAAENMMGGDLGNAQSVLMENLGIPYMIILGIVVISIIVASLNLMAKRVRDIGLPGWIVVLAFIVISALISRYVSNSASNGFSTLVGLALLFVPSDTLGGNRK